MIWLEIIPWCKNKSCCGAFSLTQLVGALHLYSCPQAVVMVPLVYVGNSTYRAERKEETYQDII